MKSFPAEAIERRGGAVIRALAAAAREALPGMVRESPNPPQPAPSSL
jgi:hypothetical protein